MRRSSLPNAKDNLAVSRSNLRYPNSPNVSRSWAPSEIRARPEGRLSKSVGDRGQERKVLEWCKKNNLNIIRKLPKLDPAILTSRDVNTQKFTSFVDEAKLVEREPVVKPLDFSKTRIPSAERRKDFCEFCQREIPKKKKRRRQRAIFFTSPYECEHCGASNDIYDDSDHNVSSSESEDDPVPSERVRDTIRRGNPAHVIDHRNFSKNTEKSDYISKNISGNISEKVSDPENDEGEIFWRNESEFDVFEGKVEDKMADLDLRDLNEPNYGSTVFLTETSGGNHGDRPVEVRMAWDDDSSSQFAEVSRTFATDDGIEEDDVTSRTSENSSENFEPRNSSLLLENETDSMNRLSPTPPPRSRAESPRSPRIPRNPRYGENHRRRNSALGLSTVDTASEVNDMAQSPIANRSVGLSRVALMRLTRQGRGRSRGSQSSPGTPVARIQEPRSHSHDPLESYSFLDAVSPEVKSIHKRKNRPDSADT